MFRKNAICCRKKSQQAIMSKQLGPGALCYGYGHCSQWGEMKINFLPENWNSKLSVSLTLRSWPISMSLPPHHPSYSSDVPFRFFSGLFYGSSSEGTDITLEGCLMAEVSYFIAVILHAPLRSNPQNQGWKSWTCICSTVLWSFCIASVLVVK